MSTLNTWTSGSIAYAMSISATPSIWNAVEIAIRGAKRSSAHARTVLRLLALELDRELAGLQLV